ncbi:cytokine receptor family member B15 [Danio aesculapii]|uniref:cytokine receptor family member B15 n=1 Tax=Danio aesculapii TaxID=1142201 RepID=UPI0024C0272D|nr:cytokine receptor family member B15 [Danio aesculapii]XP_056306301.1 cytokine receptor family member B15 [Danio aesculapii]
MLSVMIVKLLIFTLFVTKDVHHIYAEMKLAAPQNVKVVSINMGAVVEWTSQDNSIRNMTYTVRYVPCDWGNVSSVCVKTTELKCDAGVLPFAFGCYIFQVRAEKNGMFSEWAKAPKFIPYQHTIIGPPAVHLVIQNNSLDVTVRAPVLKIGKLSTFFSQVSYTIKHQIEGIEDESIKKISTSSDEDVKLSIKGLHPWSRYCVQAKVDPKGLKEGEQYSTPVCVTNVPVLVSCGIAAVVLVPLALLAAWLIYKVYRFLYPKTKLPEHLKNLFVPSFWSAEATQHPPHQKEQHDKISTVSEDQQNEELCEKIQISEDEQSVSSCVLAPIEEMEEDYKLLMHMKPAPLFYPNQLYPLCLKNSLFTLSNQSCCGGSSSTQASYYNVANSDRVS